jgi:hypothetical protein
MDGRSCFLVHTNKECLANVHNKGQGAKLLFPVSSFSLIESCSFIKAKLINKIKLIKGLGQMGKLFDKFASLQNCCYCGGHIVIVI